MIVLRPIIVSVFLELGATPAFAGDFRYAGRVPEVEYVEGCS